MVCLQHTVIGVLKSGRGDRFDAWKTAKEPVVLALSQLGYYLCLPGYEMGFNSTGSFATRRESNWFRGNASRVIRKWFLQVRW